MIISGYDTTVGRAFKTTDHVDNTIKTLHLSRSLTPTKKEGVFVITHETELKIDVFAFPLTLEGFNRKLITVYDERPFRNKSNNLVVQQNELTISKLAAFLQHDVATGNLTPLKQCRAMATKGFSEAISTRLIRPARLDLNEGLTLKVLLSFYFVGLQETNNTDLELVTANVVGEIYGTDKGYIDGVISGVPKLENLGDLLKAIQTNPTLYKLKHLGLKELISSMGGISFMSLGNKIVASACEAPCLFTAMVYGSARFKAYSATPLGEALDPKRNKGILESFTRHIDYTYDLNG